MMMPPSFVIFQLSIVVLLMTTFITTTNIPQQPTAMIAEMSQSYDDERNPTAVLPNHHINLDQSKHIAFTDDDNLSDEESDDDHFKANWPQMFSKRLTNKAVRGGSSTGDSRVWAIPYRFGKRAAMPYRFGKRAGMHFRLGKKSASL